MVDSSDKMLFNQVKKRNKNAFSWIFNRYWEELFLSVYHVLKDEEVCKDIVQEIFVTLWNRSSELEINNLKAYLLQSAKYQSAKFIRDNRKFDVLGNAYDNIEIAEGDEQSFEYKELYKVVDQKINELPKRCREVFRLSRNEGLTNKQIGEKLNISVSTVENQITKAIKFLKHELSCYTAFFSIVVFFLF